MGLRVRTRGRASALENGDLITVEPGSDVASAIADVVQKVCVRARRPHSTYQCAYCAQAAAAEVDLVTVTKLCGTPLEA